MSAILQSTCCCCNTQRLPSSWARSETRGGVTFDTSVQQGSVLSPTLFNVFLNLLLRLLTVIGHQRGISHWIKGIVTFNNLAFPDDLTIVAEIRRLGVPGGGAQMLLNVIEEFSNWMPRGDPVRYLVFFQSPEGDWKDMVRRVLEETRKACDKLKLHPLNAHEAANLAQADSLQRSVAPYEGHMCGHIHVPLSRGRHAISPPHGDSVGGHLSAY